MNKILLIFSLITLLGLSSCDDFLDVKIDDKYDEEMFIHSGFDNLKKWGLGTYSYLRHYNALAGGASLAAACDEADFAKQTDVQKFNTGAWNQFTNPDDVFSHYYKGIRHANLFLEKTENYEDLIYVDTLINSNKEVYLKNCDDFKKLRAEVRVLRAYFYFELIKRYGGVPLVKKTLSLDDNLDIPRNSFDECVDYIVTECDEAYKDLTNYWANYSWQEGAGGNGKDNTQLGRIEKPVAKFLKQKALLYAASPLHNPNNDIEKWKKAAIAGHEFMVDPNCVHVRFLGKDYKGLFYPKNNNDALVPWKGKNTGIIFTRPFEQNGSTFEKANYPVGLVNGGGGCICPSQNLLDAFEVTVKDGSGKIIGTEAFDWDNPNHTANPYNNRDPRLGMIVVTNGSKIGKNTDGKDHIVETYNGGVDGIGVKYGATTTGYYLRKMLAEDFDLSKTVAKPKSWVLMRYAEFLLNYAEAVNRVVGPDGTTIDGITLVKTARNAVNDIRNRDWVKLPKIANVDDMESMESAIRHERQVELAFEDQRFFDVRRWKIASETENKPLYGINIYKDLTGQWTYERFKVEDRKFEEKMYYYPIPYSEIMKSNGILKQNNGWE